MQHLLSCIAALQLFFVVQAGDETIRRLTSNLNPNCDSCGKQHYVLYVNSSGPADTMHMLAALWDRPAVVLLRTPPDTKLSYDWDTLLSSDPTGAINLSGSQPLAAFGISIPELVEFDDPADKADLYDPSITEVRNYSTDTLQFGAGSINRDIDGGIMVKLELFSPLLNNSGLGVAGRMQIMYEVVDRERRSTELPHLEQTGYSALVKVVLDGLDTGSNFSHPRFGVRLTTVGDGIQKVDVHKSLDDEYTPGVFKLFSIVSDSASSGFAQWRPVAYTSTQYDIEHSTTARAYNLSSAQQPRLAALLRAYFGSAAQQHHLPVTFGIAQDGWYTETKYAAWSVTVGLGSPPSDKLSLMVILLLGIGLGVPAAAMVVGAVWITVRKLRGGSGRNRLIVSEDN